MIKVIYQNHLIQYIKQHIIQLSALLPMNSSLNESSHHMMLTQEPSVNATEAHAPPPPPHGGLVQFRVSEITLSWFWAQIPSLFLRKVASSKSLFPLLRGTL